MPPVEVLEHECQPPADASTAAEARGAPSEVGTKVALGGVVDLTFVDCFDGQLAAEPSDPGLLPRAGRREGVHYDMKPKNLEHKVSKWTRED